MTGILPQKTIADKFSENCRSLKNPFIILNYDCH